MLVTLATDLAVVVYLLLAKRLFGLRGGAAAEAARRDHDVSWAALERHLPDPISDPVRGARAGLTHRPPPRRGASPSRRRGALAEDQARCARARGEAAVGRAVAR